MHRLVHERNNLLGVVLDLVPHLHRGRVEFEVADVDVEDLLAKEEHVVQVHPLPWQRNLEEYLKIIDNEQALNLKRYPRQGSKVMVRKRAVGTIESQRKAMMGLPLSFYNERWLSIQSEEMVQFLTKLVGAKSECGYYFSVFCGASMVFPQMMLVEDFPDEVVGRFQLDLPSE